MLLHGKLCKINVDIFVKSTIQSRRLLKNPRRIISDDENFGEKMNHLDLNVLEPRPFVSGQNIT